MKKMMALLLAVALLISLASVSLADNSAFFGGKLIGTWENYSPKEERSAALNDFVVTPDKATRGTRDVYLYMGETGTDSCFVADFYNDEWHVFKLLMAEDGQSFVIFRPTSDIGTVFRKR